MRIVKKGNTKWVDVEINLPDKCNNIDEAFAYSESDTHEKLYARQMHRWIRWDDGSVDWFVTRRYPKDVPDIVVNRDKFAEECQLLSLPPSLTREEISDLNEHGYWGCEHIATELPLIMFGPRYHTDFKRDEESGLDSVCILSHPRFRLAA